MSSSDETKCVLFFKCFLIFSRYLRGQNPSAAVRGLLWSETGQREEPERLILQQI